MSNYTKATNFTAKDSLPTGDSNKIIKGTEIDNELTAVASAVASKADSNSPTFTGTPTAPNPSSGTNNTQIATTSFVNTAITSATGSLGTLSQQDDDAVDITGGTIDGVDITTGTLNSISVASIGTNAVGTRTISSASPSGGNDGDIWYKI